MILAQHALGNERYHEFYRRLSHSNPKAITILDNGAYEKEMVGNRELLELTRRLRPTYLVSPDVIGDGEKTWEMFLYFMVLLPTLSPEDRTKVLLPLHGAEGQIITRYRLTNIGSKFARLGGVCFPRVLREHRVRIATKLQGMDTWNDMWYHHALGCWDDSLTELPFLRELGFDSIDSRISLKQAYTEDFPPRTSAPKFNPDAENYDKKILTSHIALVDETCSLNSDKV